MIRMKALEATSAELTGSAARSSSLPFRHALAMAPRTSRAVVCAARASSSSTGSTSEAAASTTRRAALSALVLAPAAALVGQRPAGAAVAQEDFVTAPSGIKFIDTKEGTGPEPVKGALIRCHYTGRLASNGRVFDSSYERGRPLTFRVGVGEVIRGWDQGILGAEGLPPMKEGGKRTLIIPAELAYGSRGAGGVIPPNADLVFDVELLGKPTRR